MLVKCHNNNTMTNVEKLNNFKKNYPAANMGDLQSFCLGLKASEDNINFLKNPLTLLIMVLIMLLTRQGLVH